MPELQDSETAGVPIIRGYRLKFHYVLGLVALGTLDYLKLHCLVFIQGAEALALDGAVMHEDIGAVIPADEAKTFGIIKPFYRTSFFHYETSFFDTAKIYPPKKQGAQQSGKKKSAGRLSTHPIIVQDSWPGFQSDMLNCIYFTRKLLNVKLIKINACSPLRSPIEPLK
jgi:hypothetical protein